LFKNSAKDERGKRRGETLDRLEKRQFLPPPKRGEKAARCVLLVVYQTQVRKTERVFMRPFFLQDRVHLVFCVNFFRAARIFFFCCFSWHFEGWAQKRRFLIPRTRLLARCATLLVTHTILLATFISASWRLRSHNVLMNRPYPRPRVLNGSCLWITRPIPTL
jgi:hypothetical protein